MNLEDRYCPCKTRREENSQQITKWNMAIGDCSTAKRRAKNNKHVRLKMKCCRLVELIQNIRIKIANVYSEHTKKIRLKDGKYL